ncbi:MAG: shikimate dehydrogenase [Gammaproteobacteria bacterium]|nr:shikimate dehydrogenase [Gammaproteobacteria bacterium]MBU2677030.1 shikimate dehydrogenase [Gammaproteobacteria bacterium]NNC58295.1 shikimate dehydrogenase [Woeseiaceae bacterium]NNL50762.1 shikimate dehydrogenase [Woeseiaceae bacterium]
MDRYGVMGYPISHSRSPVIHRLFAMQTNQELQYELLQVSPEKLESAVRQFQRTGGKGLNITVPHKGEVTRLVDQLSERASTAGAVNTLIFKEGEIHGDNTDGFGLLRDLVVNLELSLEDTNILILGAGGATRGIVGPLLEMQPASVRIANRTLGKAQALADHFSRSGPVTACRFNVIPVTESYDLIINATSAGIHGDTPPYPTAAVSDETVCYDLSYGLSPTPFSLWAREHGAAKAVMGWGMLVEQAAESFRLWRNVRPDTAEVLQHMNITA